MAEASISPRSTALSEHVCHERFSLVEELLLHHGVELGASGNLHEYRPNRARMGADVSTDLLPQSQQIVT